MFKTLASFFNQERELTLIKTTDSSSFISSFLVFFTGPLFSEYFGQPFLFQKFGNITIESFSPNLLKLVQKKFGPKSIQIISSTEFSDSIFQQSKHDYIYVQLLPKNISNLEISSILNQYNKSPKVKYLFDNFIE
jgi:hypothetical protein